MTIKKPPLHVLALVGLIATNLFWSGNIYVSKLLADSVPPLMLNSIRWLIAIAVLLPFTWRSINKHRTAIKQNLPLLTLFGFIGVTLYNTLLYSAAHTTSGINMAVISSLTPVVTFLFTWLFTHVAPRKWQLLGLALGVVGVLILIGEGSAAQLLDPKIRRGDVYLLIAVSSWAVYTALLAKSRPPLPPLVLLQVTIVLGSVLNIPAALWEFHRLGGFTLTTQNILALLYVGIFPSVLSFWFYNQGVLILGGNVAALSTYLLPVFTAVISIIWLGEQLQWYHIVGQALVFAGFAVSLKRQQAREPTS